MLPPEQARADRISFARLQLIGVAERAAVAPLSEAFRDETKLRNIARLALQRLPACPCARYIAVLVMRERVAETFSFDLKLGGAAGAIVKRYALVIDPVPIQRVAVGRAI